MPCSKQHKTYSQPRLCHLQWEAPTLGSHTSRGRVLSLPDATPTLSMLAYSSDNFQKQNKRKTDHKLKHNTHTSPPGQMSHLQTGPATPGPLQRCGEEGGHAGWTARPQRRDGWDRAASELTLDGVTVYVAAFLTLRDFPRLQT